MNAKKGLVLGIVLGLPLCLSAATITPVAIEGHAAPGVADNFGNIYNITINDAGAVTTKAGLTGGGNGGLWTGTPASLQLYFRNGSPAPGMPAGTTISNPNLTRPVPILTNGQVSFDANLLGGPYTDTTNNTAIWAGPLASPSVVAYVGAPAHGVPNATYDYDFFFAAPQLASGRVLYVTQLAGQGITTENKYGIWEGPINAPELLFRSGQHAPGTPVDVNFGEFAGIHLNSAGQIAFENLLQGPGATSADRISWWAGSRTNPQLVLRGGLQAPGTPTGVQFAESAQYGPNANLGRSNGWDMDEQGQVIFHSFLKGPGLDETNDSGIFAGQPGAIQLVARAGSQAPGTAPGVVFAKSIDQVGIQKILNFNDIIQNSPGTIAFNGQVTGPGVTDANDEGLWLGKAGSIQLFAREGDAAPGTGPGVVFSRILNGTSFMTPFGRPVMSDTDQIAFISGLAGPDVNDANKIGLFASDADGILQLIARSGDFLDVGNGELRQIQFAHAESFNNANQVAFIANFTDGTNGAFVATVPEPSALLLMAALLAPLHRRRHR